MNLERLQHQITTLNHRKIQASGNNSTYLPPAAPKKWNKELVRAAVPTYLQIVAKNVRAQPLLKEKLLGQGKTYFLLCALQEV